MTLFKVGLSLHNGDNPHFMQWDPDSGSDVSIINRSQFNDIQRHFYNSSTAITLTKSHSHFTMANSSRMKFDGFFTAILKTISGAQVTTRICNSRFFKTLKIPAFCNYSQLFRVKNAKKWLLFQMKLINNCQLAL